MSYLLLGAILLLSLAPQFWAKRMMKKHSENLSDIPGTGGQLVRHLKKKFRLKEVGLEETTQGDHFNPQTNTIYLTKQNMEGRSLTAVAVATHEFSHALQHAEGSALLQLRTTMANFIIFLYKCFDVLLLLGLAFAFFNPLVTRIIFLLWFLSRLLGIAVHLVTLPVELDASFRKALPILKEYLAADKLSIVRSILTACAYTYLAASVAAFWAIIYILGRRRFLP